MDVIFPAINKFLRFLSEFSYTHRFFYQPINLFLRHSEIRFFWMKCWSKWREKDIIEKFVLFASSRLSFSFLARNSCHIGCMDSDCNWWWTVDTTDTTEHFYSREGLADGCRAMIHWVTWTCSLLFSPGHLFRWLSFVSQLLLRSMKKQSMIKSAIFKNCTLGFLCSTHQGPMNALKSGNVMSILP